MGILEDLFSGGSAAPAAAPQAAPPPPNPNPSYADFYKQLLDAAAASGRANSGSLFNWLSGRSTDAAVEKAKAMAPAAWQAQQNGLTEMQKAQLGSLRDFATTSGLTGTPIDPNNPMASLPAMAAAYSGVMNGAPAAAPVAPGASTPSGAPVPQAATPAPQVDPVAAQRAMFLRMGKFNMMNGNAQGAVDFFKQANAGVPVDTVTRPDGSVGDGVTGQPIVGDVGSLLARRAGMKSGAEANAALPAKLTEQSHQGGVDVGVHSANANTDASHELVNGIDPTTGKPVTRTKADILHAGNFVSNNPYFDSQQAELKELRAKSESADQGLNLGVQIVNAANGITTGKGANAFQDARKWAQTAAQLTGNKLDPKFDNDTSKFEQLKFAAQQLVAVASHDLSPRVAMNIYNQIKEVKPGDTTSMVGLRDIIMKQLIPVFQRNKALLSGTSEYYKKNPIANDAMSSVPDSMPLSNFGVRSVHDAKPGDYFADPQTGNLRQRPK